MSGPGVSQAEERRRILHANTSRADIRRYSLQEREVEGGAEIERPNE